MTDQAGEGRIVSVYAVFGSEEEAGRIARAMIEQGHAACVNILGPCLSIYRWHGKVEQAEEIAAIFKTAAGHAHRLIEEIGRLHSYDVPAAVAWPVEAAAEPYRAWVVENSER